MKLFIFSGLLHILSSRLCIIVMMLIPCFVLWSVAYTLLFSAFDGMAALDPCLSYQFEIELPCFSYQFEIELHLGGT